MVLKLASAQQVAAMRAQKPGQQRAMVNDQATLDPLATVYGCCKLFDICTDDDLMAMSLSGSEPFLDWIGWTKTDVCVIKKSFITWMRPEYSGDEPTAGYVASPCTAGHGVEFGECDFTLEDFGLLKRVGPVRNLTRNKVRYCDKQPRYRLNGKQIDDDDEYDMLVTIEVLMQDLKRRIILGNHVNAGDFDGFNVLVNNGYTNSNGRRCSSMDSIVVDMNGTGMAAAAGRTWNGNAIPATFDFFSILRHVVSRIKQRIRMSGAFSTSLRVGDMVLVMPSDLIGCVLDSFACWSVCGTVDTLTELAPREVTAYRNELNGGMFGAGRIFIDGFEIPIVPYDWGLIKSPTLFDALLLINKIGSVRLLEGQYNDQNQAPQIGGDTFQATDQGKFLTWLDFNETCYNRTVQMEPRILDWAPWTQARFIDIQCRQPGGTLSPDPTETSFYPETSFSVAVCPP